MDVQPLRGRVVISDTSHRAPPVVIVDNGLALESAQFTCQAIKLSRQASQQRDWTPISLDTGRWGRRTSGS